MSHRRWGLALDVALYLVLPLLGLFVWGWDWRPIVLLYWLENITIGGVTLIALIRGSIRARRGEGPPNSMAWPFFIVHYGMFTFVHGVFVWVLILVTPFFASHTAPAAFDFRWVVVPWAVAGLVQLYLAIRTPELPPSPVGTAYARVFALHLAIIGGVGLIIAFQLPTLVAVLLVVLHAVALVVTERRRVAE